MVARFLGGTLSRNKDLSENLFLYFIEGEIKVATKEKKVVVNVIASFVDKDNHEMFPAGDVDMPLSRANRLVKDGKVIILGQASESPEKSPVESKAEKKDDQKAKEGDVPEGIENAQDEGESEVETLPETFMDKRVRNVLQKNGYTSMEKVQKATEADLRGISGVSTATARKIGLELAKL